MSAGASLLGEGFRFSLRAEGFVSGPGAAEPEANSLASEVELDVSKGGSFRARRRAVLRTDELQHFRDQLKSLDRDLGGEAMLTGRDSEFQVRLSLTAGKGTLSGIVREWGTDIRFDEIHTDQTFIRDALKEFDALVAAFPVRSISSD
jgi:hypothetical protein